MAINLRSLVLLFVFLVFSSTSSCAQDCSQYSFPKHNQFVSCKALPVLNSYLHWTYTPSSHSIKMAYRHTNITSPSWVAWAINLMSKGMIGSQAIVAYQGTDGIVNVYTSPITSYSTKLQPGNLSFEVSDLSAVFQNNEYIIYATVGLPNNNSTVVNHLWQDGPLRGSTLGMHRMSGPNVQSMGTVDFISGKVLATSSGRSSKAKLRMLHGIINAISWGIMLPLGAILARHMKVLKPKVPLWFYLHIACQILGYLIGIAGWVTGLVLGGKSSGVQHNPHRNIGIILFCLGTLQVIVATFLRPKPDHRYRIFWNVFHYVVGYTVIILGPVNVFKGIDIMNPSKEWKNAYIGIISTLGAVAAVLEILKWAMVIKEKRSSTTSDTGNEDEGTKQEEIV
ncbi:hypothetical protein GIB67_014124 [Kingdonia uniflora]|uniref:Cytochrome b561 and DOMON domain-containing protein n=1 Tax=Kingdonia uniflora TaxID=39325 RepID=A0A7J7N4G2_9MAGN|nr:hypothetical protein GIB67_014124 [Kingdonia uniflora]